MKEENYFKVLMEDFEFESVNEEFVKFLNKYLKKDKIILSYHFHSFFPEYFLKDANPTPVAFQVYGKVNLKGLVYKALNPNILYDASVAVGPIFYTSISKNEAMYYPAIQEDPPLVPIEIEEGVLKVGAKNSSPVFVKLAKAPLQTEKIILTKDNYEKFKFNYELEKANKTPAKRLFILKSFLESEGYDTSKKLLPSEHDYGSRKELWQQLYHFAPESGMFSHADHTTKDKIDKLFNGNKYISFS